MSDIKHFEELWEEAEEIIKKVEAEKNKSINDILEEFMIITKEYQTLNSSEIPKEAKMYVKQKKLGELVVKLCELSAQENINVYASLMAEIELMKIDIR